MRMNKFLYQGLSCFEALVIGTTWSTIHLCCPYRITDHNKPARGTHSNRYHDFWLANMLLSMMAHYLTWHNRGNTVSIYHKIILRVKLNILKSNNDPWKRCIDVHHSYTTDHSILKAGSKDSYLMMVVHTMVNVYCYNSKVSSSTISCPCMHWEPPHKNGC
jgi:hypothetical protein